MHHTHSVSSVLCFISINVNMVTRVIFPSVLFREPKGLPSMDPDGKVPKDLCEKYGELIMGADGFAQASTRHTINGYQQP